MKVSIFTPFVVAACLLFPAEPADAQATRPPEKEMIQLRFPEDLQIKVLVEYVSKRVGLNLLYDEAAVRKRVTISAPTKIPKDSLVGLLESVLKMAGLAIVEADQPGWKKIVPVKELLPLAERVQRQPEELAKTEAGKIVTRIFPLRHIETTAAAKTLQPFLSKPGGNTFSIAEENLLFVTDYASNLRRILQLIELLDTPGREISIRFVTAKHRDAADLAKQVTSLLKEKDSLLPKDRRRPYLSLTFEPHTNQVVILSAKADEFDALELIEALDVPSDAETQTYYIRYISPQRIEKIARELAGAARLEGRYRSVIDAESGMLIVTAPPSVHKHIADLQKQLDVSEVDAELSHVRFYKLMNTTASEVLATIRSLETGEAGLSALAERAAARAEGAPQQFTGPNVPPPPPGEELPKPPAYRPPSQPETQPAEGPEAPGMTTARMKDATVAVDTNTNTLIVVASPNVQRIYKQLITMLDKRRPQVMIEATLVTLDTSEDFSLGIDLSHAGSIGDHDYLVFSAFGLSTVDPVSGALALKPGVGFNGALIGPTELNAVIKALTTCGRAKVVSAPRVLVNDNATATLTSVSEAPFTSVNASDTVSTTSFAGYASAGMTLTVTPHISEGDHLQLRYSVTLNSFAGEGGGGIPPPRQTNSLTSEITIPNGHAVIVGGLKRMDSSDTATKVPWLGDIPVLGHLFRFVDKGDVESTLFVFLRPVILRDDQFEDLKYLSERDLKLAELPSNYPDSDLMLMY